MTKTTKKNQIPKFKKITLDIDPYQGAASLATSISYPGYKFQSMKRTKNKVTITFVNLNN